MKHVFACLSVALLIGLISAPVGHADDWTILEYDDSGRVTGTRSGTGTDGSSRSDGLGEHNRRAIEPGEILVVDPTSEELGALQQAGFRILRQDRLTALDAVLVQLQIPRGMSVPAALTFFEQRYPRLMVGTNDLMDLSQASPARPAVQVEPEPLDFSRDLSGWGSVPDSCGAGIVLGQIDGFVDTNHTALRGKSLIYNSFLQPGRVPAAADHGTAVAVMLIGRSIGGRPGGLLPGAKLYAANIFERRGSKDVGNLAALVRAVDWLLIQGVRVANLSIAGQDNVIMRMAINRSLNKGLILVAAAGNNGPDAPPAWPAAHPNSFAVTAIDRSLRLYQYANRGDYIDFAAPGVDIPTETPNGIMTQSGTSFAAPFITAMVALHLKAGFEANPDIIRRSLQRYTMDLGSGGKDGVFGWGLVRLRPSC